MIADRHPCDFADDPAIGESRSLWSLVVSSFLFLTSPYRQPQSRLHGRARYGAGPAPVVAGATMSMEHGARSLESIQVTRSRSGSELLAPRSLLTL